MSGQGVSGVGRNSTQRKSLEAQRFKAKGGLDGDDLHIVDRKPISRAQSRVKKNEGKKCSPSDATRSDRRRDLDFRRAAAFGTEIGLTLSNMVTLSWNACAAEDGSGDAPWLAVPERHRVPTITRQLRGLAKRLGFKTAYIYARAVGSRAGLHLHIGLHWRPSHLDALIQLVERGTGAPRDHRANAIRSECGGWHISENYRGVEGATGLATYIAQQHMQRPDLQADIEGRAFGVSQNLGLAAQKRAGWTPKEAAI